MTMCHKYVVNLKYICISNFPRLIFNGIQQKNDTYIYIKYIPKLIDYVISFIYILKICLLMSSCMRYGNKNK